MLLHRRSINMKRSASCRCLSGSAFAVDEITEVEAEAEAELGDHAQARQQQEQLALLRGKLVGRAARVPPRNLPLPVPIAPMPDGAVAEYVRSYRAHLATCQQWGWGRVSLTPAMQYRFPEFAYSSR